MTPSPPLNFGVVMGHETTPRAHFATWAEAKQHADTCADDDFPNSYYVVRYQEWRWVLCYSEDAKEGGRP